MAFVKKYQNVSYKELISYAENNPNRHLVLDSIEIDIPKEESTLSKLGLEHYTASIITPSGILGVLTYIADPNYYYLAAKNVRTQLVIDITTKLQQQTDELKNTSLSRKRKKIYDLIGAAYNNSHFEDKDYLDLYHGVSVMCNTNFILIKEAIQDQIEYEPKKQNADADRSNGSNGSNGTNSVNEVSFVKGVKGTILFSSNPINWKYENPTWIIDYRGRWIAMLNDTEQLTIASWLQFMEKSDWGIQWPEVEGTKTEIVEKLSTLPTWQEQDKKLSKDVLSLRLGRMLSLSLFEKCKL